MLKHRETQETEVKIAVPSLAKIRRALLALGATVEHASAIERNTLFDRPTGELGAQLSTLRVRSYGRGGALTFKGPARIEDGLKRRLEIESEVLDPRAVEKIAVLLGFLPSFRYEKKRAVLKLGRAVICLDETPLGSFVEIEGTKTAILSVARRLGLDPSRFLATSYPAMWRAAGRRGDMVFSS